jgi:hypothetical protein
VQNGNYKAVEFGGGCAPGVALTRVTFRHLAVHPRPRRFF